MRSQAAGDHPHAGDVTPVGVGDGVQAVGGDPEAEHEQADAHAERESRRAGDVAACRVPRGCQRDDHQHAEHRGVGAGQRQVEQVEGDEGEPAGQERALQHGDPPPHAPPPKRRGRCEGGGHHS
jgi:hypothetical protein